MAKIKWRKAEKYGDVVSHCGRWRLQPSRNIHGIPLSWSVFDETTNPEWLDDRLVEVSYLKEAKEWVESYATS